MKKTIINKTYSKGRAVYIILTLVLILITTLSIRGTAYSMEKTNMHDSMDPYYKSLENEYTNNVKNLLSELGYSNAGIMLTKVVDVDGNREYTLSLHHKLLSNNNERLNEVTEAIKSIGAPVANSSIYIMTTN